MTDNSQANQFIALTPDLMDELTSIVFGDEVNPPALPNPGLDDAGRLGERLRVAVEWTTRW